LRHIAVRATSVQSRRPFTAPGLGDRIHLCTVGWLLSPVALHVTADKMVGGQFRNKPESWREIVSLFPKGSVTVQAHDTSPNCEADWLDYLRKRGIDAEPYRYGDYPGPYETPVALDISQYFKRIPLLTAETQDVSLPERFYTAQWDASGPGRAVDNPPAFDLPTVIVGGQAEEPLRWSLKAIAYAMSRAEGHVGVDSAFMHMALLYMPPERIRIYHRDKLSHHVLRARDNGAVCVRM
jgi:hypothetical protein